MACALATRRCGGLISIVDKISAWMKLRKPCRRCWRALAAFFDIFDLSFFVSGAVSVGALWLGYKLRGGQLLSTVPDGYLLTGILLGCYVLGLLCFALGRALRQGSGAAFSSCGLACSAAGSAGGGGEGA